MADFISCSQLGKLMLAPYVVENSSYLVERLFDVSS